MTGEQLRAELARIAEQAPTPVVPDDTFRRGRRATLRARALVGAAAVVCLVVAAALMVPVVQSDRAPVADTGRGAAVPDRLYFPDDDQVLPLVPLSEVGPAVAVMGSYVEADQVVVLSQQGDYVRTRLPHARSAGDVVRPLLSPDGDFLAYPAEDRLSSYLALVDLRTGEIEQVELADEPGAILRSAQWSPDGDWLAWTGQRVTARTGSRSSYGHGVAGVVRIATSESRPLRRSRPVGWSGIGVCDDGAVLRFVWPAFLVSGFDGDTDEVRGWSRLVGEHGACAPPSVYAQLGDPSDALVGWIPADDEALAVVVQTDAADDDGPRVLQLLAHDGTTVRIGEVDAAIDDLSLATGLMTADRPTVPAGPDPWADPWVVEHWRPLLLVLLAAGAAVALVVRRTRAVRR